VKEEREDLVKSVCPSCKADVFEMVERGATKSTTILGIDEYGMIVPGVATYEMEADEQVCFRCLLCGHKLEDEKGEQIGSQLELARWSRRTKGNVV